MYGCGGKMATAERFTFERVEKRGPEWGLEENNLGLGNMERIYLEQNSHKGEYSEITPGK